VAFAIQHGFGGLHQAWLELIHKSGYRPAFEINDIGCHFHNLLFVHVCLIEKK
jgi:hypothetical protein